MCHRPSSKAEENIAGEYGNLKSRCDTPIRLVEEAFLYMKEKFHKVDFVIYTGDSVRHNRDKLQPRMPVEVMRDHRRVIDYFVNSFDMNKTLVIPTIGNNDAIEHNRLGLSEPLYKELLKLWSRFKGLDIHSKGEARESFLLGGYWVQSLPNSPTTKVIILNSMFLYIANNHTPDCDIVNSPGGSQLNWLEYKLNQLKNQNIKVYIMGHVPPNDELGAPILHPQCHQRFVNIIGKFHSMILAQFWGHINGNYPV